MSGFRLSAGGDAVDRASAVPFTWEGRALSGLAGDSLASALLASGVRVVARSVVHGRPRGIVSAGMEEPSGYVEVGEGGARELLPATTVELSPGLAARSGSGRLAVTAPGPVERHDRVRAHADVLVVGAGPAGLAAAKVAAATGARVMLIEALPRVGGPLRVGPDVRVLPRTTCLGLYDANEVLALERRVPGAGPGHARTRLWHIRAAQVVFATGAFERPIVFADDDRPGIMLSGAVRTYLERYAVAPGRTAVLFTGNDHAYGTAEALHGAGVAVACVVDARETGPGRATADRARRAGIEVRAGSVVRGTMAAADGSIAAVRVGPHAADRAGAAEDIACDLLAVSGGWDPNVGIVTHTTGRLGWEEALGTFVPRGLPPGVHVAGGAAGDFDAGACIESGYDAGERAVRALGRAVAARSMAARPSAAVPDPAVPLFIVPAASPEEETRQYVDLHRDATVADLRRAVGAGLRSIEHVKRYTLVGTAPDQGRTSGVLSAAITAGLLGVSPGDLGTTTARPPQVPVTFAALAGRDRGTRFDPERVTAIHDRHVAAGAVFEPVGQWLRARFYPLPGEDMEAAVQRECAAVRERVGMADVSTLGKIDVRGPDAGEFLDRVYTGAFSTLAPGRARYGLMLRLDGMLFDDGVTTRLAPDHFQMTTTTGNAAAVMDWLEEWLQTEWPDLRVHCASVTEQWAVVAVAGPRSRDVMAALAPGLDVTAAGFPFMTVQESTVAGLPARIFRISFSGELAYEVNVEWWHGQALWDAVGEAGRPHGIVPYGTEAMHVLRAEKGYFIVGQETDGSVTPVDLGLEGMLSTRKDFLGRRSLRRPDLLRPDRKQLVGLLPLEPDALLVEGSQLVADARVPPPVPMLGHVTASYRSSALGRTFALALVKGGRSRHGEVIQAVHLGAITEARITSPLFYDPEDRRRDG